MDLIKIGAALTAIIVIAAIPLRAQGVQLSANVRERVDNIFSEWNSPRSPGCALGIYVEGKLVYGRGYGMASLELEAPITTRTCFHLASTSKQFTALAVHLLARDGALSLDDDVRKYIPELPTYGTPVSLRHLLHHTGGIRDYLALLLYSGFRMDRDWLSLDETLDLITAQQGVQFPAGDRFSYSNSGYWLLAEVIERVSKQPISAFCKQRIFDPLGMRGTVVQNDLFEVIPNAAQSYRRAGDTFRIDRDSFLAKGDGWVFTCIEDLARWDHNFEDPRVGDSNLVKEMLRPSTFPDGSGDYGSGLRLGTYRGQRIVEHDGGSAGWGAQFLRFPGAGVSIAVLSNLAGVDASDLAFRVADVVLEQRLLPAAIATKPEAPAKLATIDPRDFDELVGSYVRPEGGTVVHVLLEGDSLYVRFGSSPKQFTLGPVRADRFRLLGYGRSDHVRYLSFRRRPHASPTEVTFEGEGLRDSPWKMVPARTSSRDSLAEWLGLYWSDELKATYRLAFAEGGIQASIAGPRGDRPLIGPLLRVGADAFSGNGATFRFGRDAEGRITSFRLSERDLSDIWFKRLDSSSSRSRRASSADASP